MMLIGEKKGFYLKQHLVPFGEYFPLKPLSSIVLQSLKIPLSDLSPGPKNQPLLNAQGIKIAPFICYEIAYPKLVLRSAKNADLLVTITDDSWFGTSKASAQHLQIAQMRALETGRYILFSTNNGITAIINPQGKIIARAPVDTATVLHGKVYAMSGKTPFMQWNEFPISLVLLILL